MAHLPPIRAFTDVTTSPHVTPLILPGIIWQTRKLRPRELRQHIQGNTASRWRRWDLNPGWPDAEVCSVLSITPGCLLRGQRTARVNRLRLLLGPPPSSHMGTPVQKARAAASSSSNPLQSGALKPCGLSNFNDKGSVWTSWAQAAPVPRPALNLSESLLLSCCRKPVANIGWES